MADVAIETRFLVRPAPPRPEPLLEPDRPQLYIITTPREMREQWERWGAIRRDLITSFLIIAAMIVFVILV